MFYKGHGAGETTSDAPAPVEARCEEGMMSCKCLSALVGLAVLFLSTSAFAAPDRLLDALLSCKPEFFSVLKEERAALGPVRIDFDEDESNSPHGPPQENDYEQMAIFAKPIAIAGFPIIGYSQRYSVSGKQTPSGGRGERSDIGSGHDELL
jgi:hypothetical protein